MPEQRGDPKCPFASFIHYTAMCIQTATSCGQDPSRASLSILSGISTVRLGVIKLRSFKKEISAKYGLSQI